MSKFSYIEFSESIKYYTRDRSPIENCKDENHYINLASKIKIKKEVTIVGLVNKINDDKSFTVSITDVILDN